MKFGDNLKKLRKKKKMSQELLAERVGVSRQSVSKWECGEAYPTMDNIFALCKIFDCHINDLVQENLIDIDSLDEEIKMSIVKFKKEKQMKMKGLSKAIYILARIGSIVSMIGIVCAIVTMIFTSVVAFNTEVKNNEITIFNEKFAYDIDNLNIKYKNEFISFDTMNNHDREILKHYITQLESHSKYVLLGYIEVAFIFLIATLVLLRITLKHLEKLFMNIHNGETPFTLDNVDHIKKIAIFMIAMIILPNIGGVIAELIIAEDLNIGFELLDLIYILFLFSMAYIFEYGYEIQLDSKGKMYGEENE